MRFSLVRLDFQADWFVLYRSNRTIRARRSRLPLLERTPRKPAESFVVTFALAARSDLAQASTDFHCSITQELPHVVDLLEESVLDLAPL